MKTIKIKYVDFWPDFDVTKDYIYNLLKSNTDYFVELSDEPDYLIYSVFGYEHLYYNCIKIFFAGEEQSPDFNIADYAIGFDDIKFGDRYFRLPLMYQPLYRESFYKMINRDIAEQPEKREFCSFVVSNSQGSPIRERFFDELSKYKKVDSGGRYRNNVGGPVADKLEFESHHKFSISFENVSHPGYMTEKIMQAFGAGCIPIYWGDPLIEETFNEKSFINIMKYSSMDEAIEEIRKIDQDDVAYLDMLNQVPLKPEFSLDNVETAFSDFVYHIFNQDVEKAGRLTRMFWNKNYNQLAQNKETLYRMSAPLRGIRSGVRKFLRK